MKYDHILSAMAAMPWAMEKEKIMAVLEFLTARAAGEPSAARFTPAQDRKVAAQAGGVAVIPVFGVIANRMGMMDDISGGTSAERLSHNLQSALGSDVVKAVILDVDSPGGTVSGIPELHKTMMDARGAKPVIAQVNATAGSAAYWIASAADEIVVTPSGRVGSIGVYSIHEEISALLEMAGISRTIISAGENKTIGNPYEPLTDEARAVIQKMVDEADQMFNEDVARGRGVSVSHVREHYGQGLSFGAKEAVSLGMADRVGTMQETLARFGVTLFPDKGVSRARDIDIRKRKAKLWSMKTA